MRNRTTKVLLSFAAVVSTLLIAATAASASTPGVKVQKGGALTFLKVSQTWPTFDPATNSLATSENAEQNAIYGELFEQNLNASVTDDLASGYQITNKGKTVTIDIRPGVKFTDGTAFTAQAVQWNFQRDLTPSNGCVCLPYFSTVTSITTSGKYKVILHLSTSYAIIIQAFTASPMNWMISPSSFASEGAATFGQHPVGAGPFEVVSNVASSLLVTQKNPNYWEKGHPYLSSLTFIGGTPSDTSAYAALQSGQVQLIDSLSTVGIIDTAATQGEVQIDGGVNALALDFNTQRAPFNNLVAREAVSYATDPQTILNIASPDFGEVVESPSGPADGPFFAKTVPGYHAYNLSMAQSLVSQLGGLSFQLMGSNSAIAETEEAALQNEWTSAGMKVTLLPVASATSTANIESLNYAVSLGNNGDPDPDIGIGSLLNRFGSTGSFSGVRDPALDGLINQSEGYINVATRAKVIQKIYKYISDNAYAVFIYDAPVPILTATNVVGAKLGYLNGNEEMFEFENIGYKA